MLKCPSLTSPLRLRHARVSPFQDHALGGESRKQKTGFGVGAFEEEDDDIYEHNELESYDRQVWVCA